MTETEPKPIQIQTEGDKAVMYEVGNSQGQEVNSLNDLPWWARLTLEAKYDVPSPAPHTPHTPRQESYTKEDFDALKKPKTDTTE